MMATRFGWMLRLAMVCAAFPVVFGARADEDSNPYIRRPIPAKRLSEPPEIDGDLSDTVWQEAAVGETFVEQKTNQPVADQTKFWIGYDQLAIYVAAYCYDAQPDKIIALEKKRDARLWGDDHIRLNLDLFHTHDWDDFSEFAVNPLGTQSSRMGGGRSGKAEWKGEWQSAGRIVADGWVVEMAIPWNILNYPSKKEPMTVGFNIERNHARKRMRSIFSNIGTNWRNEWAADWVGVELPARDFKPEILALPFLAAGTAEKEDAWKQTARGGVDLRYRPTPTLTGLVTLNPDFRNIQAEVEGIDFTRGERYVNDSRPFFQEGRDNFSRGSRVGNYFYSNRIANIDLGAKFYGKLAKRTNVGFLGAYDLADQYDTPTKMHRQDYVASFNQGFGERADASLFGVWKNSPLDANSVLEYRVGIRPRPIWMNLRYGSSAWKGIENDGTEPSTRESNRGETLVLGTGLDSGHFFTDVGLHYVTRNFRASDGFIDFPGRRGVDGFFGYYNNWTEKTLTGIFGGMGFDYEERFDAEHGLSDFDGVMKRAFSTLSNRDENTRFFRDGINFFTEGGFKNNIGFDGGVRFGHFREEDSPTADLDWDTNFSVGKDTADRKGHFDIGYGFGRADGTFRHFVSPSIRRKFGDFSAALNASILRHIDRKQQHILSFNYDFTDTVTIGGRVVFQRDERLNQNHWNPYFMFRRSGGAGMETFLILGDPSGEKFSSRLEGKVLLPL